MPGTKDDDYFSGSLNTEQSLKKNNKKHNKKQIDNSENDKDCFIYSSNLDSTETLKKILHNPDKNICLEPFNFNIIKGDSGVPGRKGDKGNRGKTGKTGPQGETGHKGKRGPTGHQGKTGKKGSRGHKGHEGNTGPTGMPGSAVAKGDTGSIGVTGPFGPLGNTGPIGLLGPTGINGPIGLVGPIGPTGSTGPIGPQGFQGIVGPIGPIGAQGVQGIQGLAGGIIDYAYFYNNIIQLVPSNTNITFNQQPINTNGILYTAGNILIVNKGVYKVSVYTLSQPGQQIALSLNGSILVDAVFNDNYGQTIITVPNNNTTLNLVNTSTVNLTLPLPIGIQLSVNASIIIERYA